MQAMQHYNKFITRPLLADFIAIIYAYHRIRYSQNDNVSIISDKTDKPDYLGSPYNYNTCLLHL